MDESRTWWIKVSRAEELISEFDRALDPILKITPDDLKLEGVKEVGDGKGVRQTASITPRAVPARLSAIAGDAFHNLRTSLDHLAVAVTGRRDSHFPIISDVDKLKQLDRACAGLNAGLAKIVREAQPCYAPEPATHPLTVLQGLDNQDKHRSLAIVVARHRTMYAVPSNPVGGAAVREVLLTSGATAEGNQGLFELVADIPRNLSVNIRVRIQSDVVFADPPELNGQNVVRVFFQAHKFAATLLEQLESYLPRP